MESTHNRVGVQPGVGRIGQMLQETALFLFIVICAAHRQSRLAVRYAVNPRSGPGLAG